jgi:hypothetical protein
MDWAKTARNVFIDVDSVYATLGLDSRDHDPTFANDAADRIPRALDTNDAADRIPIEFRE